MCEELWSLRVPETLLFLHKNRGSLGSAVYEGSALGKGLVGRSHFPITW